jgi:hypothetical protein
MTAAQVGVYSVLSRSVALDLPVQVYQSLLRWHAGKIRNWGNLKCTAHWCQINDPFQLSVEDIKLRLRIYKEKCNYFQSMENVTDNSISTFVSRQLRNRRTRPPSTKFLQ